MASGTKSWNSISPQRTLSAGIGTGDTSLSLSGSVTDFPTAPFGARITDAADSSVYENILVGAKSGSSFTSVTRGYDGTSAQTWASGSIVEHVVLGEDLNDIPFPDQANEWTATQTFSAATPIKTDVIAEETAAAGVTVDSVLLKDGVVTADLTGDVTGDISGATATFTGIVKAEDLEQGYTDEGNTTGAKTINLSAGNVHKVTLTGNVTFTFSGATSGKACSITLVIVQDSTPRTITWPASVDWPAATAPTLSTGSGDVDVFTFVTVDGGTIWYGFTAGQDMG